jgi:serine/threonine protein kinase
MKHAPRIIGRYALYGKIASGGMATVHYGRLLGPVGFSRTVAIKKLHPHFSEDPEFVSMFLDEARLAARIRHPNVVPTLDVVATDGELFLVMDYVQGETLGRLLRRAILKGESIPIPVVAAVFSGVLHGLHAAHEAKNERGEPLGLVHRDVSPQNIIIGVDGVARVLDFGVAKAAGRLQTTREGQIKGKISYMAPEQIHGASATRKTDVYGLAVVLWETLAGRRLFHDDNELGVLQKVLESDVEPPSAFTPGLPEGLDAIVLRGLSRNADERYATAREMASALESLLSLAIPVQVGEWVERIAGANLASQAARIAEIESGSDPSAVSHELLRTVRDPAAEDTLVAPPPPAEDTLETLGVPDVDVEVEASVAAQMSSISAAVQQEAEPTADRRKSLRLVAAGIVGACAVLAVAGIVVRTGHPGVSSDLASSVRSSAPAPVPQPLADPPPAMPPPPSAQPQSAAPVTPAGTPTTTATTVVATPQASSRAPGSSAARAVAPPAPTVSSRHRSGSSAPAPSAPPPPPPAPSAPNILFTNPG